MSSNTVTNLKILGTVVATLGVYTWVANAIPQLESDVPEEVTFSSEVSAEELVDAGEDVFLGAGGCTACHGTGTRAPNLRDDFQGQGPIGTRCGRQVDGMSCKEYLRQAMVEPNAYIVEGFPPIMPPAGRILSNNQLWATIAYLQSLGGEVTVTAADIQSGGGEGAGSGSAQAASSDASASSGGGEGSSGELDPVAIMQANTCFACHTLGDRGMDLGPPFDGMGSRRSADYIRNSILNPNSEVAEGYESMAGTMPPNFDQLLSDAELDAIVDFLASRTEGGEG